MNPETCEFEKKDAVRFMLDFDMVITQSGKNDEKAFPNLLRLYKYIDFLPLDAQIVFNYEIGRWYFHYKKYNKAIEYLKFVLLKIQKKMDNNSKCILYNTFKHLCECYYNLGDIKNHEVCFNNLLYVIYGNSRKEMVGTYVIKKVNLHWAIEWIIIDNEYKKWVLDNKLDAAELINSLLIPPSVGVSTIGSPKILEELSDLNSALISLDENEDDFYALGKARSCMKKKNFKDAITIYNKILSRDSVIEEEDNSKILYTFVYQQMCICIFYINRINKIAEIYGKYTSYKKTLSLSIIKDNDLPNELKNMILKPLSDSYWIDEIEGFKDWMIKNCPEFRKHIGITDEKVVEMESVKLSSDVIEMKNKEISIAKDELAKKEESHLQPTLVVEKKDFIENKKSKKNKKKKKSHRKSSILQQDILNTVKTVPKIETNRGYYSIPKEDELIPLVPLTIPLPTPIEERKKNTKIPKKISLDQWINGTSLDKWVKKGL